METEVEIKIKCENPMIKVAKIGSGGKTSILRIPVKYDGMILCCIPTNFKFKLPKPNDNHVYNLNVKSSEIYYKKVYRHGSGNIIYLPSHLIGVDILFFEAPKIDYEIL